MQFSLRFRDLGTLAMGVAVLWISVSSLSAQSSQAQITGTISDPSDAAVPSAKVVVTNIRTGIARTTSSNVQGVYTVPLLEPGQYRLEVNSTGFQPVSRSGITLDVNQTARIDFVLQTGIVTERIQVVSQAPLVESTSAELGTVVTQEKISDLPLNARNFTQLLTLTPGVSPISVTQNAGGNEVERVGIQVFPSINGQQNRSNSFTLDGIFNNGHFTGTYMVAPSVDALNEFKVQSHSDLAEFGGATGGVVNISSKSGTNELHGSLYEFLRNDKVDARDFFAASKATLRQNQFGAAAGGPVLKNKTFFFGSYEGYRRVNPSTALTLIPTPQELSGDFSTETRRLYDPYSTKTDPANSTRLIRDLFPNQRIPASLFNKSTQAWAKELIPTPIDTGFRGFNARNTIPQTFPADNYSVRIDHRLSGSDFLWGRYTWGNQEQKKAQSLPGGYTTTQVLAKNLGVSYARVISANTVLNTLFGFASSTVQDTPAFQQSSRNLVAEGLFKGFPDVQAFHLPATSIAGFFNTNDLFRQLGPQRSYQVGGSLSYNHGSHSIKIGGDVVSMPWANKQERGSISFGTRQTADLNNLANTGSAAASFLLGLQSSVTVNLPDFALTSQIMNLFVQDSWKVTRRLTVNFGLRWDLLRNASYTKDFESTWDFHTGTFLVGAVKPGACSATHGIPPCLQNPNDPYVAQHVVFTGNNKLIADDHKMFGPRLGLAYRLRDTTVFRGTMGVFHDAMNGVTGRAQNGNIGNANWPGSQGRLISVINNNFVEANADAPFIGDPFDVLPNPSTVAAGFFDPNLKQPYSIQWNVDIQQQFGQFTNVSIAYVGSHNLRLDIGGSYNAALFPGPGPVSARNLFPYAPVSRWERSIGQSSYNALQVKTERRMSHGFTGTLSYTWSKSIDQGISGWSQDDMSLVNPYDPNGSKSVSGYDIPHTVSVGAIYQLPFGPGRKWARSHVASHILGNWQINLIANLRSGQPFTLVTNQDIANIGAVVAANDARPDLVGNMKLSHPTPELWFNTKAFAAPAPFTYGTAGRNIGRTDSQRNFDLSLFREDRITERIKLQFRAEAFNAFNHPTFAKPQVNFTTRNFGTISDTVGSARQIQAGLKLLF